MLQAIREKAQGWIAWAIVILISIPFALFGIQEYLSVSSNPVVAEVDGTEITTRQLEERVRDFRENLRRQLGEAFDSEMFSDKVLKPRVLQAMIDETVLRQAAEDWNMRVSDRQVAAYIQSLPGLQNQGKFDMGLYEATVRSRGLTKAGFEALVRQEMIRSQQEQGIRASVLLTRARLAESVRLGDQKREVALLRIPAAGFLDQIEVSEEDARQYYEAHRQAYQVPERVRLAYIRLDAKDLADQVEVDEEKLKDYFESHRNEFSAPQERRVRHILIPVEGDDAAARAQAEKILAELRQGADFAELAQRYSKDPGSAAEGGDLGWVSRGVMVKPFEEAAFGAEKGELVGPVKTEFGYHIIQVTDLRGGAEPTFEQMRAKVEAAYRRSQAEELYFDYLERLADLAYETPDSLVPVAEALDLKVKRTDWVTRRQPPPELPSPKVLNTAFSDDVLGEGNNSDVIELSPTSAVVLRVAEHEEATVRPFEEVKAQVIEAAKRAAAADRARAEGERLLARLRQGAKLADLAGEAKDGKVEKQTLGREGAAGVAAEVVRTVFSIPTRGEGPRVAGVVTAEGDYVLVAVDRVIDGDLQKLSEAEREQRRAELERGLGDDEFRGLVQALRARADIEVLLK